MSEDKRIGKIKKCRFGFGGYQDAQIGISFMLGSDKDSWGVGDFWGYWAMERSDYCKWTEEDRITYLGKTVMRVSALLRDANVNSVEALSGIPVEVTFEGMTLQSWRVLTEVI